MHIHLLRRTNLIVAVVSAVSLSFSLYSFELKPSLLQRVIYLLVFVTNIVQRMEHIVAHVYLLQSRNIVNGLVPSLSTQLANFMGFRFNICAIMCFNVAISGKYVVAQLWTISSVLAIFRMHMIHQCYCILLEKSSIDSRVHRSTSCFSVTILHFLQPFENMPNFAFLFN